MKKIKIRIFAVHAKIWERAQYGASLPFAVLRSRKTGVRTEEGNPTRPCRQRAGTWRPPAGCSMVKNVPFHLDT